MLDFDKNQIDLWGSDASTIANAQKIAAKRSFYEGHVSADQTLIVAKCQGSKLYDVSVDFISPLQPVFRCDCPSRKIPCKHALGLLYFYLTAKSGFGFLGKIPDDIAQKRAKLQKRAEKSTDEPAASKQVNEKALVKKLQLQLDGLNQLEKLIHNLLKVGLSAFNQQKADELLEQTKEFGNFYLTQVQRELKDLHSWNSSLSPNSNEQKRQHAYERMLFILVKLHSLQKNGKEYLQKKIADPLGFVDKDSTIEEYLGKVWHLAELESLGLVIPDAELVELSFNETSSNTQQEYVEETINICLNDGQIYNTYNYRPYKAKNYIKENDTVFDLIKTPKLYLYPGGLNRRVRFEEAQLQPITAEVISKIKSYARSDCAQVLNEVKNYFKHPLAQISVSVLLKIKCIGLIGNTYVAEAEDGTLIEFNSDSQNRMLTSLLKLLRQEDLNDCAMCINIWIWAQNWELVAEPVALISDRIIRLAY